ncbi:MAG: hypothetical protein COA36_08270 [Desulfotalea sp.]|nr:MAG: hypothetical protein COA36_08270 [Desulfotalea sp.]
MKVLNMLRNILLFGLCFCFYASTCNVAVAREIQWEDLVPKLLSEDDPMAGFSEEERDSAEWIIYLREYLPEEVDTSMQEFYDEMNIAIVKFEKKGLDVDKIIAERRLRNSAVNTELDGQDVTLAGYLLPLELSGDKITDFLLVPYIGACIHTPPPPPNQIVHAVSVVPISYQVDRLFKPVSIQGRIKVKSLSKDLFLTDGSSSVDIGYTMSVESIEDYKP